MNKNVEVEVIKILNDLSSINKWVEMLKKVEVMK